MSSAEPVVMYSAEQGVANLRFNRPRQLNALNLEVAEQLSAALDTALNEPSTRVIVLSGEGAAFMAGGDLALFREATDRPLAARGLIDAIHASVERLAEVPQIVIASLHGAVAGAGMSIALGCDLVIAAEDTRFSSSYVKVADSPDCGATWALPRQVGLRRALEIALLSDSFDVQQAHDLGLVNRVVPADRLAAETAKLAHRLATGPVIAHAWIKKLMRRSVDHTLTEQLQAERDAFTACAATGDFADALDAFFDRRAPVFRGH